MIMFQKKQWKHQINAVSMFEINNENLTMETED